MLIAICLNLQPVQRVCTFVISEWDKSIVGSERVNDVSYIEDFIYDLRQLQFFDPDEVQQVFEEIRGLSLGPLRTAHSGTCRFQDLPMAARDMLEHSSGVTSCNDEMFAGLLNALTVQSSGRLDSPLDSSFDQKACFDPK